MKYTSDYLISQRKLKWENSHDLEYDKLFREAVANEIVNNKQLLQEVIEKPEKLIELVFVIVDKEQKTVPFFLNEVQQELADTINKAKKDYIAGSINDISILALKGRQQGITSFVTAYQLSSTLLNKNFRGFTLADVLDNTESIFQSKAKFVYEQLPIQLRPSEKYNNRRQLLFEKLNSNWAVDTATENVGRSQTINFFHGSECAFWKCGIASIQAGLGEAFTKNCIKIYESTANGFNDFEKMWSSKIHINCFFEWWKTKEYVSRFENENVKQIFISNINTSTEWIYERLKWLRDIKKLTHEQLYWYFNKYQNYIDKELIKQEYPCSPEEAFLSTGDCIFETEKIIKRIAELKDKKPLKKGFFLYTYQNEKVSNIEWLDDNNGYITIYEEPKKGYPYVLGGDTAGDGSDMFIGQVTDNTNDNQVAILEQELAEDIYTFQMYCLGMYYNKALVGIENNYSTYPTMKLAELNYPNIYIRAEAPDKYTGALTKYYGFETNKKTRPLLFTLLIKHVRDNIDKINDINTLEEMLTVIRNEKGRPEAQQGRHDDHTMALGINLSINSQQTTEVKVEYSDKNIEWTKDMLTDYYNANSTIKKIMEGLYGKPK